MALDESIKTVMEEIRQICQSETVVGKPIQSEDTVIVPVSKVSFGFGAGGGASGEGTAKGSGTGIGGGANIEPIAFIVVVKGKVHLLPLKAKEATVSKMVDLIPTILEMMKGMSKKKEEKEEKKESRTRTKGSRADK